MAEEAFTPRSPALRAEIDRWPWLSTAWADLSAGSRSNYDEWVLRSWSTGSTRRRARAVARRAYAGREWAGQPLRTLQAIKDQVFLAPEMPDAGSSGP